MQNTTENTVPQPAQDFTILSRWLDMFDEALGIKSNSETKN